MKERKPNLRGLATATYAINNTDVDLPVPYSSNAEEATGGARKLERSTPVTESPYRSPVRGVAPTRVGFPLGDEAHVYFAPSIQRSP